MPDPLLGNSDERLCCRTTSAEVRMVTLVVCLENNRGAAVAAIASRIRKLVPDWAERYRSRLVAWV
jgi:hypothetical protein